MSCQINSSGMFYPTKKRLLVKCNKITPKGQKSNYLATKKVVEISRTVKGLTLQKSSPFATGKQFVCTS